MTSRKRLVLLDPPLLIIIQKYLFYMNVSNSGITTPPPWLVPYLIALKFLQFIYLRHLGS